MENIGELFDFERPYWAGEHPVEPNPAGQTRSPTRCRSTPSNSARTRCEHSLGSASKATPTPEDVDAEGDHLHGFGVAESSGPKQAGRKATIDRAVRMMGPPQPLRMGSDGKWHEIPPDAV